MPCEPWVSWVSWGHRTAARDGLKAQYARPNVHYPDVRAGLSCLFRPGASLDELAREGSYRNPKLRVGIVQRLVAELAIANCGLVLYVTLVASYPDHHTLVVARGGVLELTLRDDALDALIRAMTVVTCSPALSGGASQATLAAPGHVSARRWHSGRCLTSTLTLVAKSETPFSSLLAGYAQG
jgi:hypothetical protein